MFQKLPKISEEARAEKQEKINQFRKELYMTNKPFTYMVENKIPRGFPYEEWCDLVTMTLSRMENE